MAWVVLIVAGLFEAVWATALGKSEGFTKLWPSVIFFITAAISMGGLAWAMKTLPTGSAYAIWVSIGASAAVAYGMISGDESFSIVKVLLLIGMIACVIGLKLVSS
ncbi:multidrug efflux SMR transporter [Pseudoglutamicibacter albus]|uniref:DMT family transporter n=1 Tax=Pseudoglutamicibacter albus TaxID=98671 RepID=UPI000C75A92C|nr:multidrug efflux SMR transporter [Pseudoglutamicibacter albus]PKY80038.1 ligand-binding protein SH3 [Pseudoglutamicibacter albus]WIK83517.1 multidrug efflux SMR transporter [Pseudoglutamicibacter albus]